MVHGRGSRISSEGHHGRENHANPTTLFGTGHHGAGRRHQPSHASFSHNTLIFVPPRPSPIVHISRPIDPLYWPWYRPEPLIQIPSPMATSYQTSVLGSSAENVHTNDGTPVMPSRGATTTATRKTLCCKTSSRRFLFFLVASFCAFFFSSTFRSQHFILNPGEMRRVQAPNSFFYKSLYTEYDYSMDYNTDIRVYTFYYPDQDCPPLTGPVTTLTRVNDVNLAYGDFEYDYYFLNPGSRITVTMQALLQGTASLYLLRGKSSFDVWCIGNNHVALVNKQVSRAGIVIEYTVPVADFYYVVYDNPNYSLQLLGTEIVAVQATSYAVAENFRLSSGMAKLNYGNRNSCILVQVTSVTSDVLEYDVPIAVTAQRRWEFLIASAGFMAAILTVCFRSTRNSEVPKVIGTDDVEYSSIRQQPPAFNPEIPIVEATLVQDPSAPILN